MHQPAGPASLHHARRLRSTRGRCAPPLVRDRAGSEHLLQGTVFRVSTLLSVPPPTPVHRGSCGCLLGSDYCTHTHTHTHTISNRTSELPNLMAGRKLSCLLLHFGNHRQCSALNTCFTGGFIGVQGQPGPQMGRNCTPGGNNSK